MTKADINAKPCFLNGHDWTYYSDCSQVCDRCGLYYKKDPATAQTALVNEILRRVAGKQAIRAELLKLPKAPSPILPPPFKNADGGHEPPAMLVVLPIAACLGIALGLVLWRILGGVLL